MRVVKATDVILDGFPSLYLEHFVEMILVAY